MWRIRLSNQYDKLCMAVAWRLPKRLITWCAVRLMAHATQGEWSSQIVPDLKAMDALKRWELSAKPAN